MQPTLRKMACVDVPELPLQLLLRAHPDWRGAPVAVVAEERPEAPLLLINRQAHQLRLRTGMRFGEAKSLLPELRAGAVSALEVERFRSELVTSLQTFSPHVACDPVSAGVFYVDPAGLSHLYGGELNWARCVHRYLRGRGLVSTVVVGYGRALSYALARVTRGVRAVGREDEALRLAKEVPLDRLHMTPALRDALDRLGLTLLGDLAGLGADPLLLRLGSEAAQWCRVIRGEEVWPLHPEPHVDAPRAEADVEPPDADVARLCFVLKRSLDLLLESVRQRGQSVRALWLHLVLERAPAAQQRIEPATPSRDARLWLELLRLRLSSLCLDSLVTRVCLQAETCDVVTGQLAMFPQGRDLAAGERALARILASFGEGSVCRAVMEDAHLPEAKFRWENTRTLLRPKPAAADLQASPRPLVRRIFRKPARLDAAVLRQQADGSLALSHQDALFALTGPYPIHGAWWAGGVARDYYYGRTADGPIHWMFYDHQRDAWFVQALID